MIELFDLKLRGYYKTGDLVRFYDFSRGNKNVQKPRPAMVLGYDHFKDKVNLMKITSKGGATERKDYKLMEDEIKVPKGMWFRGRELYGVIKTNNIIQINSERLTSVLDVFSFDFKMKVMNKYDLHKNDRWYKKYLDMYNGNHRHIMSHYKESLIAEKLNFFQTDSGENIYDFIRNEKLAIEEVQVHPKSDYSPYKNYSVTFRYFDNYFNHIVSTRKSIREISMDWKGEKTVRDWLREDVKFHILKRNIHANLEKSFVSKKRYHSFNKPIENQVEFEL